MSKPSDSAPTLQAPWGDSLEKSHGGEARGPQPQTIGPYRVLCPLGEGGMGEVFLAHDPRLGRSVAIKRLTGQSTDIDEQRTRLRREARVAARLNHPAIAQIYDLLIDDDVDHIVMEYVPGTTLRQLLIPGPLTPRRALPILLAVTEALAFAHGKDVIHRDLKTENVLVDESQRVKLVDFGLARSPMTSSEDTTLTRTGMVIGTCRAMAPEQVEGHSDARSDLFSLGVLFYETLTGTSPFLDRTPLTTLMRVVEEPHRPANVERSAVPQELSSLIDRLLEKKPAHRPESAEAVVEELRRLDADILVSSDWAAADPMASPAAALGGPPPSGSAAGNAPFGTDAPGTVTTDTVATDTVTTDTVAPLDPRRLVTLLVCESEADDLDFPDLVREAVDHFEGHLHALDGRRATAFFGYPKAHEDDARRAVHTAQEILRAAGESHAASLRCGVHSATVDPSGVDGALNKAITQARRLARAVDDGLPRVSDATQPLIAPHFTLRDSATEGHSVVAGRDPVGRLTHLAASPVVGRDHELELLMDHWERARHGRGQVVMLSGEAGVGKSRLVYALHQRFVETTPASEGRWLLTRTSPYAQSSPFHALITLLEDVGGLDDGLSFAERESHLADLFTPGDHLLAEDIPWLLELLGVPSEDPAHEELSPDQRRRATLQALLGSVRAWLEERPLALVVEDLHWADPSTLEWLGILIDQMATEPLLLVLTCRHTFNPPWGHRPDLTQLQLGRLIHGDVDDLLGHLTRGKSLPPTLRDAVVAKADGLPLFLEELVRTALDSTLLEEGADGYALRGSVETLEIPASLRESLVSRLERLGPAKEIAQVAAVLERRVTAKMLAALTPPLEAEDLRPTLDRLTRAAVLDRRGFGNTATYRFRHALLRDAAYASVLPGRRQRLHAEIARILEERFPHLVRANPEELAHHLTAAGDLDRALDAWLQASQSALARAAAHEAERHAQRGLDVADERPDDPSPSAEHGDDSPRRRRLALELALGSAAGTARGFSDATAEAAYRRAFTLVEALENDPEHFQALHGLWTFHVMRADLEIARDIARRLVELAKDPIQRLEGLYALGFTEFGRGALVDAHGHLEEARTLGRDFDDPESHRLFLTEVSVRSVLGLVTWILGRPDQAIQHSQNGIDLARRIDHPFSLASALINGGRVAQLRGDTAVQAKLTGEARDVSEARGFGLFILLSQGIATWGQAHGGSSDADSSDADSSDAAGRLEELIQACRAGGANFSQTMSQAMLAEVRLLAGELDAAEAVIHGALDAARSTGEGFWTAELHRLLGEVASRRGDTDGATESFHRALDIARGQGALSLELRAALSLAQLPGHGDDGRRRLQEVYGRFDEGAETADVRSASALLEG